MPLLYAHNVHDWEGTDFFKVIFSNTRIHYSNMMYEFTQGRNMSETILAGQKLHFFQKSYMKSKMLHDLKEEVP